MKILMFFLGLGLLAQQPTIKVTYKIAEDRVKDLLSEETKISLSEATFILHGADGHWEKPLIKKSEGGWQVENVEFAGFDAAKPHTLSVRLKNSNALNGHKRGNGYEAGEAFKFTLSPTPGSQNFEFAPVECEGKKADVSLAYALFPEDSKKIVSPIGYEKSCKVTRRWVWQKK